MYFMIYRHKTRQQIGQLAKETGSKLKAASDHDHNKPANVGPLQPRTHFDRLDGIRSWDQYTRYSLLVGFFSCSGLP